MAASVDVCKYVYYSPETLIVVVSSKDKVGARSAVITSPTDPTSDFKLK